MFRLFSVGLREEFVPGGAGPIILDRIDLTVAKGDRLGVCGPIGAGKSSLLLIAVGLVKPTSGRVEVGAGQRVALVLQEPENALFARSVREELAYAPRRLGAAPAAVAARIKEIAFCLGLDNLLDSDPRLLSAADRRLTAIGAVLTGSPDLLLLDEPTAGLSAAARTRVIDAIERFQGTVVIASHDLDLLWRTCGRLAVLAAGRLIALEEWPSFVGRPETLEMLGLDLPVPLQVLAGLIRRGWLIGDFGRDEAGAAAAVRTGIPPGGPP